jgi:hypothetical protein
MKVKIGILLIVSIMLAQSYSLFGREAGKYSRSDMSENRFVNIRERQFAALRAILPPKGIIGYASDARPEDMGREYFLIQYALAPLVVVNSDSGVSPEYVVGVFDDTLSDKTTSGAGGGAIEKSLVLVRDFGNGVMLFRGGGGK